MLEPSPASTTSPRSITAIFVGERAGEVEILLDQQDRHPPLPAQVGDGAADILDDGRLDAFGRLVEHEELRLHDEGAGDGELLLLAAGEIAAAPRQHGLEHREKLEQLLRDLALVGRQTGVAGLEVLAHRQQREDLAPLRHVGDAAPRPLVGAHAGDVLALEEDAPAAHRLVADDGAQQRALAHAVAAEHAGDLAALGADGHLAQRLRRAVVQIDALNRQHVASPRIQGVRPSSSR